MKNDDPFAPWNNPMVKDNPFAPHNGFDRDSPFKPWNEPFTHRESLSQSDRDWYDRH